jgi:hypothetical protein
VVEPLVGRYPLRQIAEGEGAVAADLVQVPFPGLVGHPGRGVLGPCLVRVLAPPRHWGRPGTRVGRDGLLTVVGELVVVPDSDKGNLLVHLLQVRIRPVLLVRETVIRQVQRLTPIVPPAVFRKEELPLLRSTALEALLADGLVDIVPKTTTKSTSSYARKRR